MNKIGIIVRSDLGSGLQTQTLALTKMIKPDRVLIVNSQPFNGSEQHDYLYEGFEVHKTQGWPTNLECARFIRGLTHIITAETIYNPKLYELARVRGVKVFTQLNWEFLDHLNNPRMPKPYKWLMPSYWNLEKMQEMFGNTYYLPPPIFINDFKKARERNFNRSGKRRFVHIMGKVASHDRNGTYDLIDSLKYSTADFELVIKSQYPVDEYTRLVNDPRIKFEIGNNPDQNDLFSDFDAVIMPRRYGGLCLPMNEALASGLPVIMTDISPNSQALPAEWLVKATAEGSFMARTKIDIYKSDTIGLAKQIDWFATMSDKELSINKSLAFQIACDNYSSDVLLPKYKEIMEL